MSKLLWLLFFFLVRGVFCSAGRWLDFCVNSIGNLFFETRFTKGFGRKSWERESALLFLYGYGCYQRVWLFPRVPLEERCKYIYIERCIEMAEITRGSMWDIIIWLHTSVWFLLEQTMCLNISSGTLFVMAGISCITVAFQTSFYFGFEIVCSSSECKIRIKCGGLRVSS